MAESPTDFATVLGPDAKFKGDVTFDSAAKVMGHVEGSIKSKGRVLIAQGAKCKASIAAKELAVEGLVEGNVEAAERVEIKPNGRITGDIVASRMTMADGAAVEGNVRIGIDGKESGKAAATAEPKAETRGEPRPEPRAVTTHAQPVKSR